MQLPRAERWVAFGIATVVLAGFPALVFGPARGARADIATQRDLITQQLAVMRSQLALQHQQLDMTKQQLNIPKQHLAASRQTLNVAHSTKADVDLQLAISRT